MEDEDHDLNYRIKRTRRPTFPKKREIVRKRNLEDELNRFENYSSDAHRYLWDAFESYPSSRNFDRLQRNFFMNREEFQNSYLEETG